jgi:hypothetical protein
LLVSVPPASAAPLSFAAAASFAVGTNPQAVAVGDFNGDGKDDLATANWGSDNVSVLLNNGSGGFAAPVDHVVGTNPCSVAVGDFNGDGKADLAVANVNSNNVSVLLNNGSGGFAAHVDYAVGTNPQAVAVGDFNGDGKDDLAVANSWSDSVSVLPNNGSGGFATAVDHAVGSHPYSVAVADFNSDGKGDLATANWGSGNVSILLNDGSGGFAAHVDFVVGAVDSYPNMVAAGDLNGDGSKDLAVVNGGHVSALLNNGSGGFAAHVDYAVGTSPRSVAVGDFSLDGKADLAVANSNYVSSTVSVLLNNGSGGFAAPVDYAVGNSPGSVAVGDFNGDLRADLVTANFGGSDVSVLLNTTEPITGTMWLNAGATYANQLSVTIDSTITGATEMRFRDAGGAWTSWEPYAAVGSSTLLPGDGPKTVEAEYRDAALNVLARSDDIFLDTRKPVTKAPYVASARRGHTAYLKYKVTDPRPGSPTATVTIKVKNHAGTTVKTLTFINAKPVNTLLTTSFTVPRTWKAGTYKFYVYATDLAGNKQVTPVGSNKLIVR